MQHRKTIVVIFGGTSSEHEVSIVSARSVIQNLDSKLFQVIPVKISKSNHWLITRPSISTNIDVPESKWYISNPHKILSQRIDVVFPVLHGPFGEDGIIQGLLDSYRVPYVGCGVLSSAICMDKVIQKQICTSQHIPIIDFIHFTKDEWRDQSEKILIDINQSLGFPCFTKPANQGSSIGISKATNQNELAQSIQLALSYSSKILVEKAVTLPREIECAVLGNQLPQASVLGEIVPSNEFYDYDAKYIDGQSKAIIPAELTPSLSDAITRCALDSYRLLNCAGLARVDFLVDRQTNKFYLNEVNTMPGFTTISMYPKLWQATGISYSQLLTQLIQLAFDQNAQNNQYGHKFIPKTNWHDLKINPK